MISAGDAETGVRATCDVSHQQVVTLKRTDHVTLCSLCCNSSFKSGALCTVNLTPLSICYGIDLSKLTTSGKQVY